MPLVRFVVLSWKVHIEYSSTICYTVCFFLTNHSKVVKGTASKALIKDKTSLSEVLPLALTKYRTTTSFVKFAIVINKIKLPTDKITNI